MRVLHVSQPVEAGVAAVVGMLCEDQAERGWDVRLACPPGYLADRVAAASVPVLTWNASRSPGPSVAAETRALGALVESVDPDVVHLHSSKAGLAGRLHLRGRRPTLFQPHGWSFYAVDGMTELAVRGWERAASRWTDRLLPVSDDELRIGRDAGVTAEATVVPNGVDTDRFAPRPQREARTALGLPDGPLVLCLGRLHHAKGQDRLLEAWPRVREQVAGATLVLVGDGPSGPEWRARFSDPTVLWHGAVDDPAPWYAAADVVALPSRWEGMPIAALEALASGRPVVGFDVPGVRQVVGDPAAVVRNSDVRGLADALAARLRPDGPGRDEAERGRTRVVENFGRRASADAVAAVTKTVADEGPSRRRTRSSDHRRAARGARR